VIVPFLRNRILLQLFLFQKKKKKKKKKGDLSNYNNCCGISLINIDLKNNSKVITDKTSKCAFKNEFIKYEEFGFCNHEECINLYISIREICLRRKFNNEFKCMAFLKLKKVYDLVPIFSILNKGVYLNVRCKSFNFLSNLYLSSKVHSFFLDILSDKFVIHRGVR